MPTELKTVVGACAKQKKRKKREKSSSVPTPNLSVITATQTTKKKPNAPLLNYKKKILFKCPFGDTIVPRPRGQGDDVKIAPGLWLLFRVCDYPKAIGTIGSPKFATSTFLVLFSPFLSLCVCVCACFGEIVRPSLPRLSKSIDSKSRV